MNKNIEIWKDITGHEGVYQISSNSRVRSLERYVNCKMGKKSLKKEKLLKPDTSAFYERVRLEKWRPVHRLVAEAFIPNPENKPCINHIDKNKLNNSIENLEWVTHRENITHSLTNRSITKIRGVNWIERMKVYQCSIYFNGKKNYLGSTKDLDKAIQLVNNFLTKNNLK